MLSQDIARLLCNITYPDAPPEQTMVEARRLYEIAEQVRSIESVCMDVVARLRLRNLAAEIEKMASGAD